MSKLEETNIMIDIVTKTINSSNPYSDFSLNSMYFRSGVTVLSDIAKSLAIIADNVSEVKDNEQKN